MRWTRRLAVLAMVFVMTIFPAVPALAHHCVHSSHTGPDGFWHYHGSLNVDGNHYHQWHNHDFGWTFATDCGNPH